MVVIAAAILSYLTTRRLVLSAETALTGLRKRAFSKVHELSVADHNETQRGVLLARVTSDVEGLARFAQWGMYSWAINPMMLLGTIAVMVWYSWQLTLVVLACYLPVVPTLKWLQRRQLVAYDSLRTSIGNLVAGLSEVLNGLPVLKAYGALSLIHI